MTCKLDDNLDSDRSPLNEQTIFLPAYYHFFILYFTIHNFAYFTITMPSYFNVMFATHVEDLHKCQQLTTLG